ncbi:MAG: helix-turn-helix domain-containing protein [Rhodospirillaceae bacterium]
MNGNARSVSGAREIQLPRSGAIDSKMKTKEAAGYLGISASFLEKLRVTGGGPVYCKLGRVVRYSRCDLDCFAESRKRCSTSEVRS